MEMTETGSTPRTSPAPLGFALHLLLIAHGRTAKELAAAARVSAQTISAYLRGDALTRERLAELAALIGLDAGDVSRAMLAASLGLPAVSAPWSPIDPNPEERAAHEEAAAMAGAEVRLLVMDELLRESWHKNRLHGLDEGRKIADTLKTYSKADQLFLIENAPEFQHWGGACVLCSDSEAAAPDTPSRALELAELALAIARRVPGAPGFQARLQGWCTGFVGNAQRVVGSDLPTAERTFAEAWHLWRLGEDHPAGLLSEAHLLDMEASLRRAQRLFPQALRLHDDALTLARPDEAGSILLNKAGSFQQQTNYEMALETLVQAARVVDGVRQPRLRFGVLFNRCSVLCNLGRAEEAEPLLDEVRQIAERLRNEVDLARVLWLEATCAEGLGRSEIALAKLDLARRKLDIKGLPFDHALASLDAALIYRRGRNFAAIKALAAEILNVFKAQKVHREAIAAVLLLQEAAEKEDLTVQLVRRLKGYLAAAKTNPTLVFEL